MCTVAFTAMDNIRCIRVAAASVRYTGKPNASPFASNPKNGLMV